MTNSKQWIAITLLGALLCGCNETIVGMRVLEGGPRERSPEEAREIIAANVPANYRQVIADRMLKTLKDPPSVRNAEISDVHVRAQVFENQKTPAVVVCVRLNAKNSYGGYTGRQYYHYSFEDKQIARVFLEDTPPLGCEKYHKVYSPFLEIMPKTVGR
jgi:hypothetical protein